MTLLSQISKYTRNKYLIGSAIVAMIASPIKDAIAGTLEGIIRNNDTNIPIQNVMVKVKKGVFSDSTTTDASGHYLLSSLPDDTCEVLVGKNGYKTIDATQFAISGATAGNAKMIPDSQVVNGETVYNDADEITQITGLTGSFGSNQPTWNISGNPSTPQKNVQLNGWSVAESTAIWNHLNAIEVKDNRDWFKSGPVQYNVTEGIIIYKDASNYTLTNPKNGFIFNARIYLSDTNEIYNKHEIGHGLGFFDAEFTTFMNYNMLFLPTNKDMSYLNNFCNWNFSTQNGQNNFGLSDISDSLIYNGVAGNPPEQTAFSFRNYNLKNSTPTSNYTNVWYNLPNNQKVRLGIYAVTGQKMKEEYFDGRQGKNSNKINLHGMPSGMYIMELETENHQRTHSKLVIVK